MEIALDHLVIAARTLAEGAAWVEARLGVPMGPGGKHVLMGTHNRLLSLGPDHFLEVIAVDPDAVPPTRPRWFGLDAQQTQARLTQGPRLLHWVVRTDDIEPAVKATAGGEPEILLLSRGDYRWRIGVPRSGRLAQEGISPTVIQWEGNRPHEFLAPSGCRLESLVLHHPEAAMTLRTLHAAGLGAAEPVEAQDGGGGVGLLARIRTPRGIVELGE